MLDILTFTGVDSATSPNDLIRIGHTYPKVEFGILVGTKTDDTDHGIFPPIEVVDTLRYLGETKGFHTSLHLCGNYSRIVMMRNLNLRLLFERCKGFNRVQINLHGDFWNQSDIEVSIERVAEFAEQVECESVILQHRSSWADVPILHPKVEYLFDKSGGAGIEGFNEWPIPINLLPRIGYAGGIGLRNIHQAIEIINRYPDSRIWLDMESQIRTPLGRFDTSIVEQICQIVFQEQE